VPIKNSILEGLKLGALRQKQDNSCSLISKVMLSNSGHKEVTIISPSNEEVMIAEDSFTYIAVTFLECTEYVLTRVPFD
jgi:acetate kinase